MDMTFALVFAGFIGVIALTILGFKGVTLIKNAGGKKHNQIFFKSKKALYSKYKAFKVFKIKYKAAIFKLYSCFLY